MFCECDMIILDMNDFKIIYKHKIDSEWISCKYLYL